MHNMREAMAGLPEATQAGLESYVTSLRRLFDDLLRMRNLYLFSSHDQELMAARLPDRPEILRWYHGCDENLDQPDPAAGARRSRGRGVAYALGGDPLAEDPQCFRQPSWWERTSPRLALRPGRQHSTQYAGR